MKIKLIVCLGMFLTFLNGRTQNIPTFFFPSSPNASALMKYINLPVSLDAGIPIINYELISINGINMEVPINL